MKYQNNAYQKAEPKLAPLDDTSIKLLWQVMADPVRVDKYGYTHKYGIVSCIMCGRPYAQHLSFARYCYDKKCREAYHRSQRVLAGTLSGDGWFPAELCGNGIWIKSGFCRASKYYKIVPMPRYVPFRYQPTGIKIIK